jgi:hypothetical protein
MKSEIQDRLVSDLVPGDLIWDEEHKDFIVVFDVNNRNYRRPSLRLLTSYDTPLERTIEVTTPRGTKKYSDKAVVRMIRQSL